MKNAIAGLTVKLCEAVRSEVAPFAEKVDAPPATASTNNVPTGAEVVPEPVEPVDMAAVVDAPGAVTRVGLNVTVTVSEPPNP